MTPTTALATLAGAGLGLGVLLLVAGLVGTDTLVPRQARAWRLGGERLTARVAAAVAVAVLVGLLTGWPVAALFAAAAALTAPALLSGGRHRAADLARIEAVAGWAEMLRDTMAGAAGLEQAITATAPVTPLPIRPAVVTLAGELEHGRRLASALRRFADEVADPTCDLVVAALLLAADHQTRKLTDLLGTLAAAARDQASLRLRVEAGRARTRTSVRVIIGATSSLALGLAALNRGYLSPYDSATGQLMLLFVGGLFAAAFVWLARMTPPRPGRPAPQRTRHGRNRQVIGALVCGAGVGTGLLLTARGLIPARPTLAQSLAALRQPPVVSPPVVVVEDAGPAARLTRPLADGLHARIPAVVFPVLRRDLTVLGRSPQRHLAEKVTLALGSLLLAPALAGLLDLGGVEVPLLLPVWAALLCAVAGFFIPDLGVHRDADARRAEFRHALGSFLDLVVIGLAGGGGVETALTDAASIGSGWAFEHLRRALGTARLQQISPWSALANLGEQLGVADLVELAASVGLAGAEGAKVRASLTAKAASLRTHELAAADGDAQATTERMSLPVVLLFAAFLIFIGYPAIQRVLTGL